MISLVWTCLRSLALLDALTSQPSTAYPGAVPEAACLSMFPYGHQSPAQTSAPPYRVLTSKSAYRPGETIEVTLRGSPALFAGFFVQARQVGCHVNQTRTVGVFTSLDSALQTSHCFNQIHSAISHSTDALKSEVSFYWTAPVVSSGHVVMRSTVVKEKTIFWTQVDSAPLIDLKEKDTPACISHTHKDGFHFDHSDNRFEAEKFLSEPNESKTGFLQSSTTLAGFVTVLSLWVVVYLGRH